MSTYVPGVVPTDPKEIPAFLKQELDKIATALQSPNDMMRMNTLYAYPNKYRAGDHILADGATLNPGSGAGTYRYNGATWVHLG